MKQVYSIYERGGSFEDAYFYEIFTFSNEDRAEEILNKFCNLREVDICDNNEDPTGEKYSWWEHKTKEDWDGQPVSWEIVALNIDESLAGSDTSYLEDKLEQYENVKRSDYDVTS